MNCNEVLGKLRALANPKNVEGMARFGIDSKKVLGVSLPDLRELAKKIGKNHELAQELWKKGLRETMIVASIIDEPKLVTEKLMDSWIKDFFDWESCDQACMNLFWQTPFAYQKAKEYSSKEKEFEKRAGFALMAVLAWKDKKAEDRQFEGFFQFIRKESIDERAMVKKAVNWALRQIGKRNANLNKAAISCAKEIQKIDSKSARWIASDALRELEKRKF